MAEVPRAISVEHQLLVRSMMTGTFGSALANQFAAVAKEVYFPAGKTIYREGETSDAVFFLLEGRVELATPNDEPWYLGGRAVFGVLDVELDRARDRTARAVTDVRAMRIGAGDFLDLMEDNMELTPPRIRMLSGGLLELGLSLDPPGAFADTPSGGARPSMMATVPERDARELNPFERLITLRICPLFERAGTQSLIRLSRAAKPRLHGHGESLAVFGETAESFFVVVTGSVTAHRQEPELAATFGPPELAGGYSGFGHERWAVSLEAAVDCCVLEIRYDDLFDVMEDHFDMVRAVMGHLAAERDRLQRVEAAT